MFSSADVRPGRYVKALVVCLVLVVTIGLVLPAVQQVRMHAERMACQNNLKHLAICCANYHDTSDRYPPGTMPESARAPADRLSWIVAIVPYVESDDLYSRLDKNQGWDSERNRDILAIDYRIARCTSYHPTEEQRAFGNYVGVTGVGDDAATLDVKHARAGVFGYDRVVKKEDVKDGLANTLLVVETAVDNGPWAAGGRPTLRAIDGRGEPLIARDGAFGRHVHRFQPKTSGFANAALLDGSVQALHAGMGPSVLEALATIAGKEPPPADW